MQEHLVLLRQILTRQFNEEELRTFCLDLGIDYDDLPGRGKAAKARELVTHLNRRGRISDCLEVGKRLRPDIAWDPLLKMQTNLDPETLPSPGSLPPGSRIPFARNALFTGREASLKALAHKLLHKEAPSTLITQVIQGIGGIGKTQLAVEFAHRYGRYFEGVHWISAAQPEAIGSEVAACGQAMVLPHWPEEETEQIRQALAAWRAGGPRLMILDNLEDVAAARAWLRRLSGGPVRVLITTRRRRWPRDLGLQPMQLPFFSAEESIEFLRQYLLPDRAREAELESLAERLHYLPLALELAGRYLETVVRMTVENYLAELETVWEHQSLNKWQEEGSATDHDLSMARTFAVSWARVEGKGAQRLFLAAGWCTPNVSIPWAVLEQAAEVAGEACDEAVAALVGLGLLEIEDRQVGPMIHPLLAEYARYLDRETEALEVLVSAIGNEATAANKSDVSPFSDPLWVHTSQVAKEAESAGLEDAEWLLDELRNQLIAIWRSIRLEPPPAPNEHIDP